LLNFPLAIGFSVARRLFYAQMLRSLLLIATRSQRNGDVLRWLGAPLFEAL
jgi:hypothetical protein